MRFRFSKAKSETLRRNAKRGIGFEEVQEIFARPYYEDQRSDDPEQYRAIGWVGHRMFTVVFEVREDRLGEYRHLVRYGAQRVRRENYMKRTREGKKVRSAEAIAKMADRGEDVSRFFTNRGKMMLPIQRVNVDFTAAMLQELDQAAAELNVSRQAVIKTFVRQALDQHHLAQVARKAS